MKSISAVVLALLMSTSAHAAEFFTASYLGEGDAGRTFFTESSEKSLNDAKSKASKACEKRYSKNQCKELFSLKGEGYLAVVDGANGAFGWAFQSDRQQAINEAYQFCTKEAANSTCNQKATFVEAWLSSATQSKLEADRYPPAPKAQPGVTVCRSSCFNGDCFLTYSDGKKRRVQLQQQYDMLSKKWVYPSPQC